MTTDHNKIHPLDPEPRSSSAPPAPPPYVLLDKQYSSESSSKQQPPPPPPPPPPDGANAGGQGISQHDRQREPRSFRCKCLCWTVLSFIILIFLVAVTAGVLYLVFRPKIPSYSLNRLKVDESKITSSSVIFAVRLTITAKNPNRHVGIYYLGGSSLEVWFQNYKLCNGSLPEFYQGHRNTTNIMLPLAGEAPLGSGLLRSLMQQRRAAPLVLQGTVPVRLKLGRLKLRKTTFKVRCDLVVNGSITTNNSLKITSSKCKFRLKL